VIVTCPESYHIYLGPIFITQPIYTAISKITLYLHTHSSDTQRAMTIPLSNSSLDVESPRPKDVGILAMEVYFPRRVSAVFFSSMVQSS